MKTIKIIAISLLFSLVSLMCVNAETGYVTDSYGLNLRDKPSTSGTVIASIPYKASFYISNMDAGSGEGCSKSWYYVYYQSSYGYVCSSYVDIKTSTDSTYDRPWTTPKKAIEGGAKFISAGYILNGQNTSYLKKFNVNPNSFYAQFTHQYMANLRAPAGEALSSYKSLKNNDLLNNSFNFLIPIYNNMPEQNYNYNGLYKEELPTTDETDETFEASIGEFPDSYKPYLRYLHKSYPNWTFSVLNTDLDFNDAASNEKWISSIEISSGYCGGNNTEKGWCIATDDATKFFLDPRNFLNEKYIFMFENLGYSELYTEEVVESVLKDTFMSDISVIDNEKYSTIFVKAGEVAKVSPLYLASLARQEVGTKGGVTTSGEAFTYDGFTYSGLYNFFNIGAYSSEANPALAGLVWANGGRGINNVTDNANAALDASIIDLNNSFISLLNVSKVGEYIKGYSIGTSINSIKEKAGTTVNLTIKNNDGEVKEEGIIATGDIIEVSNDSGTLSYKYVLYGDLTGDGEINSADLLKMRQYLLGSANLNGAFLSSAYLNGDDEINSADLLRIRQHLLGTNPINQ